MNDVLIAIIVSKILVLNLIATRMIYLDDYSERGQKIAQLIMVWVLPGLGALIVMAVHRDDEKPSGRYRRDPDAGDDHGASGRGVKAVVDALDSD